LFEERGVVSPLALPPLQYDTPGLVLRALQSDNTVDLDYFNLSLADYETELSAHTGMSPEPPPL
jgi:hypothetical protein